MFVEISLCVLPFVKKGEKNRRKVRRAECKGRGSEESELEWSGVEEAVLR